MEPAGLEQILRELLLPDTERIRRVRGRRDRARASRGLRERPDSDPQALPRPPSSSRSLSALCDLRASAGDPQVRLLALPAEL